MVYNKTIFTNQFQKIQLALSSHKFIEVGGTLGVYVMLSSPGKLVTVKPRNDGRPMGIDAAGAVSVANGYVLDREFQVIDQLFDFLGDVCYESLPGTFQQCRHCRCRSCYHHCCKLSPTVTTTTGTSTGSTNTLTHHCPHCHWLVLMGFVRRNTVSVKEKFLRFHHKELSFASDFLLVPKNHDDFVWRISIGDIVTATKRRTDSKFVPSLWETLVLSKDENFLTNHQAIGGRNLRSVYWGRENCSPPPTHPPIYLSR